MLEDKNYGRYELNDEELEDVAGGRATAREKKASKKTAKIMCHHCGEHISYSITKDSYVKCPKCGMKIMIASNIQMRA